MYLSERNEDGHENNTEGDAGEALAREPQQLDELGVVCRRPAEERRARRARRAESGLTAGRVLSPV